MEISAVTRTGQQEVRKRSREVCPKLVTPLYKELALTSCRTNKPSTSSWDVTVYRLVNSYGGASCLLFQGQAVTLFLELLDREDGSMERLRNVASCTVADLNLH